MLVYLLQYADWIINQIDPDGYITHRLYRQHTSSVSEYALKDIRKLGRHIEKVIIVDNLEENFKEVAFFNGIKVKTWINEMDDRVLEFLSQFLKQVVVKRVPDVRVLLKNFKATLGFL